MYGLPDNSLYRLQKIQNTAARILAHLPRFSHISATLFDLHWLPIRYRITFKIGILTNQAYHRTAPSYLYIIGYYYYSPFSDRVGLPLHNTRFPGMLMKSIRAALKKTDALSDVNNMCYVFNVNVTDSFDDRRSQCSLI